MQELVSRKHAMVAGIWANTNMDDSEDRQGVRERLLTALDNSFDTMKEIVYADPTEAEEDELRTNPFFANMKLPEEIDPEITMEEWPVERE